MLVGNTVAVGGADVLIGILVAVSCPGVALASATPVAVTVDLVEEVGVAPRQGLNAE